MFAEWGFPVNTVAPSTLPPPCIICDRKFASVPPWPEVLGLDQARLEPWIIIK